MELIETVNVGVWLLTLGQLLRIERRLGTGDSIIDIIRGRCPLFKNNRGCNHGEKAQKGQKE